MDPLANPHDQELAPSNVPRPLQFVGLGLFGVFLLFSLVCGLTEHWRRATFSLGVALIWLAVLRLLCDGSVLGVLSIRSRRFDAVFSTVLGGSMMFLAGTVDSLGS